MIRSEIVLKSFLCKLSAEKQRHLLGFLPETEQLRLRQIPSFEREEGFGSILEVVHWSWFIPTLKTYSMQEQKLFLKSLPRSAAENLEHELGIRFSGKEEVSATAASFLRQILLNSLTGPRDRFLPIEFLPPTPLKALLHLSKKELTYLIDSLSLYDLAAEMRQIVETKILKRIYSFLPEEQQKFLKAAMAHKETFQLPRMGLDKWEGDKEGFSHLLHRRGLARLGIALSGQDSDLIWYICHQLDIGRGNALFKLCGKEATPFISEAIIRQIKELL